MERTIGQVSIIYHSKDITWNVPNFREMPEEVDYAVDSPQFNCGDTTWCLRIYPNGKSGQGSEGRMGLALVREQANDQDHRVQYTVGIMRRGGQVFEEFAGQHVFDRNNLESGVFQFVNRSIAQAITQNGEVAAFCRMRINRNALPEPIVRHEASLASQSLTRLQRDYLRLLQSGMHSDVVLNVKGTEFKAHRVMLKARSTVFAALLSNDSAQKGMAMVSIEDCDSDTFPDFLQYLYTGRVEALTEGNVFSLYVTSDAYDMPDLKEECLLHMRRTMSVDTFCDVMTLALKYEERELKEAATNFFVRNVAQIIVTARWLDFLTKNCMQANDLFIAALSRL